LKRPSTLSDEADREHWAADLVQAVVNVIGRFNKLAERYQKPVIVASEQMFADAVQETKIIYALGRNNLICYHMPQQAATVLAGLVNYGEYLGQRHSRARRKI
jgi:hypothetical protein